jgi:protein gp37
MSAKSTIEWTEATWNPVTGCSKISVGCANCYAERLAHRLQAMGNKRYLNGFQVTLHHDLLDLPLKWKEPRMIFVNSMSDLFHEKVPFSFIKAAFETMEKAHWHVFQILTKRSKQLVKLAPKLYWPSNVWMGVTVESQKYTFRIDDLLKVPAAIRYLSIEPFLTPFSELTLDDIDWVIVGGESGPRSRIMKAEWVRLIRDMCVKDKIPFFFKQWGGVNKTRNGRLLDGRIWHEFPSQYFTVKS